MADQEEALVLSVGTPQDWQHVRDRLPDHPLVDQPILKGEGDVEGTCKVCDVPIWLSLRNVVEGATRELEGYQVISVCLVCAVWGYRMRTDMGAETEMVNLTKEYGDD